MEHDRCSIQIYTITFSNLMVSDMQRLMTLTLTLLLCSAALSGEWDTKSACQRSVGSGGGGEVGEGFILSVNVTNCCVQGKESLRRATTFGVFFRSTPFCRRAKLVFDDVHSHLRWRSPGPSVMILFSDWEWLV